jgi:hypothetical protein
MAKRLKYTGIFMSIHRFLPPTTISDKSNIEWEKFEKPCRYTYPLMGWAEIALLIHKTIFWWNEQRTRTKKKTGEGSLVLHATSKRYFLSGKHRHDATSVIEHRMQGYPASFPSCSNCFTSRTNLVFFDQLKGFVGATLFLHIFFWNWFWFLPVDTRCVGF